jgi:iron complex outermembrane receptor protein
MGDGEMGDEGMMSYAVTMATLRRVLAALIVASLWSSTASAQPTKPDLTKLEIEDLMNIEITSASRKEQRVLDVPAAIFVITRDDIRRSGMTSIPDLLRMVPGVNVARVNGGLWAVSVRGFNNLYANKLQVLIDGRSVYNRVFSGVNWDYQDIVLDDIDRIEVIRGPSAATWGANAVNGVINIVTRSAADTQGGFVRVDGGRMGGQVAMRYGGSVGSTRYRLFAQWTGRDESLLASGLRAEDTGYSATSGFRADRALMSGQLTFEGSFTMGRSRALWNNLDFQTAVLTPVIREPSRTKGGHVLARWSQTRASGTSIRVQSFVDISQRDEPVAVHSRSVAEVDAQVQRRFGDRHDVVAGTVVRGVREQLEGSVGIALTPPEERAARWTAFINDDIMLVRDRLSVTLGTQVQYDSFAGIGVQPTARLMWKVRPSQRLWAATGRALRTPSLVDRRIRVNIPSALPPAAPGIPVRVTLVGNPDIQTERFTDGEVGYRLDLGHKASLDVTAFAGQYSRLITAEAGPPQIVFAPTPRAIVTVTRANLLEASTRGVEVAGHWTPAPAWRIDGSISTFRYSPRLAPESKDAAAVNDDANAPEMQGNLRVTFSPTMRVTATASVYHVGRLERLGVDSYQRADVTAEWQWTSRLSIMAIGQNLLDESHPEFTGGDPLHRSTEMPRSAAVRLRWIF